METIIEGMTPVEFITAINKNIDNTRLNYALIENLSADSVGIATVLNLNINNINGKVPITQDVRNVTYSMSGAFFMATINDNFQKLENSFKVKVPRPMLSIRFDESSRTIYTGWFPLCESLGIKATVTIFSELDSYTMNWEDVADMVAHGWDCQNHCSNYDTDYRTMTDEEVEADIKKDRDDIEANGILCEHYGGHRFNFEWRNGSGYDGVKLKRWTRRYYKTNTSTESLLSCPLELDILRQNGIAWDGQVYAAEDFRIPEGLATLISMIEAYKNENRMYTVVFHEHSATKTQPFIDFITAVKAMGVQIVTPSEMFNNLIPL